MKDILLFSHPTFGVLAILAAVWAFVEALNAGEANHRRLWLASLAVAGFFVLAWIFGGWYYVAYYPTDKAIILNGPVPWAHSFFMETKEHLFFIPLILALYLPLVARLNVAVNRPARAMVLAVTALIVLNGLALEGAGAIISWGAKTALAQSAQVQANPTSDRGAH
jgi:asparagine N-glycosylation enzyme membrane subunit Stt3